MARNHTGSGVRVSWKIVPAVTEVWQPHPAHSHSSRTGHAFPDPQRGHAKPDGHRSRARYARHASSVPNFASSSVRFLGYSSTMPAYYILGSPESTGYPPQPNHPVLTGLIFRSPLRIVPADRGGAVREDACNLLNGPALP